jgi:hypothetical protein
MPIALQKSTETSSSSQMLDRAFYFIIVLWGERFRHYFLEFCLASLLSPGNIPALKTSRTNKFLIATRPEDWEAMKGTEIFRMLAQYVEPVYIEIPPCPPGRSGCEHMNVGHKIACGMAFRDKALALVLTPDCMLSDGSMSRLQQLAHDGVQLVVTAALRFGQEPFFEHLKAVGAWNETHGKEGGNPLCISSRDMAYAAVNGLHPETLSYEWDSPYLIGIAPAAWWRVPGEDGIILHCLSWAPLLFDYAAVRNHDTSMLDDWTIDGDYIFKNMGADAKMHVVQDSDEIFLASWAPMSEGAAVFRKYRFLETPLGRQIQFWLRGSQFRSSFYSGIFDPLKQEIFFLPVRWHSRPLNENWDAVETRAMKVLRKWVASPLTVGLILRLGIGRALNQTRIFLMLVGAISVRLGQALRGDRAALRRIAWHVRRVVHVATGRVFHEQAPEPPVRHPSS